MLAVECDKWLTAALPVIPETGISFASTSQKWLNLNIPKTTPKKLFGQNNLFS